MRMRFNLFFHVRRRAAACKTAARRTTSGSSLRSARDEQTRVAGLRAAKLRPADLYEVETVRQQLTAERRDLRRACDSYSGSSLRSARNEPCANSGPSRGEAAARRPLYEVETVRQQITAERRDLRRACASYSGSSLRRDAKRGPSRREAAARRSLAGSIDPFADGGRRVRERPDAFLPSAMGPRRTARTTCDLQSAPLGTEPAAPSVTAVPGGHVRSSAAPLSPTARPSIPQGAASAPCGGRGRWSRCRGRAPCPARPPAAHWPTCSKPR